MNRSSYSAAEGTTDLLEAISVYRKSIGRRPNDPAWMTAPEPSGIWHIDTVRFPFAPAGARVPPRRFLTVAVDSSTRDIVGTHLDRREPCPETVLACLDNGLKASQPPKAIVVGYEVRATAELVAKLEHLNIEFCRAPHQAIARMGKAELALRRLADILRDLRPVHASAS
jgi:hypothetical protein